MKINIKVSYKISHDRFDFENCLQICKNELNKNCSLVVIDVSTNRQDSGLPTEAYVAVDTVREDGKPVEKTWKHLASAVGAEEAEEVGVEQLLRDVHNPTAGSLRYFYLVFCFNF